MYLHAIPYKLDDALGLVKRDAQALADWALNNGLHLNTKKTQVIILGSAPHTSAIDLASLRKIRENDTPLTYTNEVKNLGVTMNQTIECNEHVSQVQSKVYAALASLWFYRRSLSFTLKNQLIKSFVIPYFDYASVVYVHVDKTRGLDLQIAHKACIRFIYGYVPFIPTDDINTHLTELRLKLGWLFLENRRHLQLITLFYKVLCTPELDYLRQLFTILENDALVSKPLRLPPWSFDYKSPRTESWNISSTIEGQRLANWLCIVSFYIQVTRTQSMGVQHTTSS